MRLPDFLFSPLTYALLLAVVLAWSWRHLPRWCCGTGLLIEVSLLAAMAPVGANALVWLVESKAPSALSCVRPYPRTIVVLSGGTYRRPASGDDFGALDAASMRRVLAAVSLWHRQPDSTLLIAGGGKGIPESMLMAGFAESMGVPRAAIAVETRSRSTWENAENVARVSPAVPKHVWLVTSALHLPRALGAFRARGFEPCAWSSGSVHVPFGWNPGYFIPQSSALAKADMAIHELVGGMLYAGLEWELRRKRSAPATDGVLPAPTSASVTASADR